MNHVIISLFPSPGVDRTLQRFEFDLMLQCEQIREVQRARWSSSMMVDGKRETQRLRSSSVTGGPCVSCRHPRFSSSTSILPATGSHQSKLSATSRLLHPFFCNSPPRVKSGDEFAGRHRRPSSMSGHWDASWPSSNPAPELES